MIETVLGAGSKNHDITAVENSTHESSMALTSVYDGYEDAGTPLKLPPIVSTGKFLRIKPTA